MTNASRITKIGSYWETIRERLHAAEAVKVINKSLGGEPLPAQQLASAIFVVNKLIPNLQAVSVQVQHSISSKGDIESELLSSGVNPVDLWRYLGRRHMDAIPAHIGLSEDQAPGTQDEHQDI